MAIAIIPAIAAGKSIIDSIFGGSQPKDGRLISNDFAYTAALNGNANGAIALKGHGGLGDGVLTGPIAGIPTYRAGSRMTAWERADVRADAAAKYALVQARYAGLGGGQDASVKNAGTTLGQAREGNFGNVAPNLASVVPATALAAVTTFAPIILIGITVLWAFKYMKKGR